MFIENLIGSKAKVKILRVLAESRTAYSLKDLVDATELSIGIIHKALGNLVEEGIVEKKGCLNLTLIALLPLPSLTSLE